MCRTKSMRSRPYALTEWFDSRASQIHGTRAPAVVGASLPVASRAWARKASTLAAAGPSPSRKSPRAGMGGARGEAGSAALGGTAGRLMRGGMESILTSLLDETREHKADYGPWSKQAARGQNPGQA